MIRVIISHTPLLSIVRAILEGRGQIVGPDSSDGQIAGDVVVTTTADTSPAACRELAGAGARVVVLTPVATGTERSRYRLAGAADYVEMTADATSLLDVVRQLVGPRETSPDLGSVVGY
jgi:hypothetical protein